MLKSWIAACLAVSTLLAGCASMTPADVALLGEKAHFAVDPAPAEVYARMVKGVNECFGSVMTIKADFDPGTGAGQVAVMMAAGSSYSAMFVAWLSPASGGEGTMVTVARHNSAKNMPQVVKAWIGGDSKFCRIS